MSTTLMPRKSIHRYIWLRDVPLFVCLLYPGSNDVLWSWQTQRKVLPIEIWPVEGLFCYICYIDQQSMVLTMMTSSNGNTFRVTGHLCGNSLTTGEFPALRPVTRSFNVFFDLRLNKRLSKQSWGWWFETPSRPFCCKYNFIKNRHLCYFNSNQFLWQLSASHLWPDVLSYGLVNDMTSVRNIFPVKIDS